MEIDPKTFPEDIEQCHAVIAEMAVQMEAQNRKVQQLQHVVEQLLRSRYGPRRERVDENQLVLFAAGILATGKGIQEAPPQTPPCKAKSAPHGRQRLPRHVARERVVYDLPENERQPGLFINTYTEVLVDACVGLVGSCIVYRAGI
jgi:transposase